MKQFIAAFSALLLLGGAASCRTATAIRLTIRTNVPCAEVASWRGVAVYVGKAGAESEQQAPTLVTTSCEGDGEIGSLVVVPSGDKDELVGVRVVAGIGLSPEQCVANGYEGGCIVARRAVRFTPHSELALDVALLSECVDIGCDPDNTCVAGACRASSAAPMTAPPAMQLPPGTPSVRCGGDGVVCPTSGDVCCLTVDVASAETHGDCRPPSQCEGIVLRCDDDTDCPRGGFENGWAGVCALSYTDAGDPFKPTKISHSDCRVAVAGVSGLQDTAGLALCEELKSCADSQFVCLVSEADSDLLPTYHWCHLVFE